MAKNKMVKTDKGSVPAELLDMYEEDAAGNLDNVTTAYFRVSIKGSKFKVDDTKIGVDGKGEEFSATLLKETPVNSYNADAYDPDAPAQQPDCWSLGGLKPVPDSTDPQSDSCITCKHNKFGSAVGKDGKPGKGKACANNRRLVLKVEGYDMPVLLSLPPTSRKNLDAYLKMLSAGEQKIPMFAMATTFIMDDDADWPIVKLERGKFLSPKEYTKIREFRDSEVVMDALHAYANIQEEGTGGDESEIMVVKF